MSVGKASIARAVNAEKTVKTEEKVTSSKKSVKEKEEKSMVDISEEYYLWQQRITLPDGVDKGVVVIEVANNSPASKAGIKKGDVIAMQGTLAAGKTTITKGIANSLGVEDDITSPTFCLVSEYEGKMPLYHIDVYRLDGAEDFETLGPEEMLYGEGITIIEWSEKIMNVLPKSSIILKIDVEADNSRTITISNWKNETIIFPQN